MAVGIGVGIIVSVGIETRVGSMLGIAVVVGLSTGLAESTRAVGVLVGVGGVSAWIKLQASRGMAQTARGRMRLIGSV
jgi:hypothetical protein